MSEYDHRDSGNEDGGCRGVSRRKVLECMTWAGTGVLWTVAGGIPRSLGIIDAAVAQEARGLTFLQISDSHVGFDKPANPNALGTLEEAVGRINALPAKPAFMIHTGDISHLSKVSEFDDADRIISQTRLDVHYVPGEHDFLDPDRKLYAERYGRGTKGAGWYSRRRRRALYRTCQRGGSENRRARQSRQRAARMARSRRQGPHRLDPNRPVRPHPAVDRLPAMGLGHRRWRPPLEYLKRFGSVTVLNGHIHQVMQKVEGNVTFHTARSTAFPQPAPGTAQSPGPLKVADDKLRSLLGIATVNFKRGDQRLAIVDTPLQG